MAIETHIHAFPRHVEMKIYPEAVPVYDKVTGRIRIGDGVTVGGKELPSLADLSAVAEKVTALERALGDVEAQAMAILGEEETEAT